MDLTGGPSTSADPASSDEWKFQENPEFDMKPVLMSMREKLSTESLVTIFKHWSILQLIKICDMDTKDDTFFTDLIRDHVIGQLLIDFNEIMQKQTKWTITKIFQVFGRSMKRIKVHVPAKISDLFMGLVSKHCSLDKLTELIVYEDKNWSFQRDYIHPFDLALMQQADIDSLTMTIKKMDFFDLLTIVKSSGLLGLSFEAAAYLVFQSKYSNLLMCLGSSISFQSIKLTSDKIHIRDHETCLEVVRCFGESLSKLSVCSGFNEDQLAELAVLINQHCTPFLKELTCHGRTLELFQPCVNVESVEIFSDHLESFQIKKCFPNIRTLKLDELSNAVCIAAHFPTLQHLEIHVAVDEKLVNLMTCLQMNKQLRSLHVNGFDFDVTFFQVVSEFRLLKSLTTIGNFNVIDVIPGTHVRFDTIKSFKINRTVLDGLASLKVAMIFSELKELTIDTFDQNVIDFVKNGYFPISKLNCSGVGTAIGADMQQLAEVFPSLEEFCCPDCTFTADDIISIVNGCDSLKSFTLKLLSQWEYDNLQAVLGSEWRSFIDDNGYVLLER